MDYQNNMEYNKCYNMYFEMVYKICMLYFKNEKDVEDTVQDIFLKVILCDKNFLSDEHEKAWLIRITINRCKDLLRSYWKKKVEIGFDTSNYMDESREEYKLRDIVFSLPQVQKITIYLYYYEGYLTKEISFILHRTESTIRGYLLKGRKTIKKLMEGDYIE